MKRISKCFLVLAFLCLISCSRETEISGEAFIVTQGAGTYKLGLVEVSVISEKALQPLIASMSNDAEVARLKQDWDQSMEETRNAFRRVNDLQTQYDRQKQSVESALGSRNLELLEQAKGTAYDMQSTAATHDSAVANREAALDRATKALMALNAAAGAERYFASLPKPVATATTDADGKFIVKLPTRERYAIAARSTRKVGDKDENYFWLIWVQGDGSPKKIMLSNNNTTDSGSPDSAIKTTVYE
jgi:hypothetical protein